jgi:penicillin amidase
LRPVRVAGLSAPATITVDRWGIPHLRAESLDDLFLVQGFNAARDRLWQIDLWRKRGLGLLAADFGPGFLEQDHASRLFLYRGDMEAEWAAYGPGARRICERFVAGVNAFIELCEQEPERLPPEFGLLGNRPARWAAEDVVRIRSHGLTRNALSEVARLNVLARADHETDLLRKNVEPPRRPEPLVAPFPIEALNLFRLAQASVTFTPERLAATRQTAGRWNLVDELGEVLPDPAFEGSNNWAVDGRRSGTGAPIMASDPHRAHAIPSLRYLVHLACPDLDVIGAGEPAVPGVSLFFNGQAAVTLTIFGADQEDVYVVETDPDAPHRYRFEGGWAEMARVEERYAVKDGPDEVRVAEFTRHGPVIWRDPERRRAVVVRSVWFEPGAAPYLQSLAMMGVDNLDAFVDRAKRWGTPSVNLLYADKAGTIAWRPAGFVPVRTGWDGLLPVPGDGRSEWRGFHDQGEWPMTVNPPEGFVFSANQMNLPEDWDHAARPVGFEWTEASRAGRIAEVLGAGEPHGVADAAQLQTDTTSLPARRVSALLGALAADGDAAWALELLRGWDQRLAADGAPAALFELWWTHHLKPALFARLVPDAEARKLLPPGDVEAMLQAVERPDARFGPDPAAARDEVLALTLASAWRDLAARLGHDPAAWRWGALHHGAFDHALHLVDAPRDWSVGPLPKGGSSSTPMMGAYRPSDFRITVGASVRMIFDLADPDCSLCVNAPGQSGDPRSAHYADLAPLWARGEYVPLLYSPAAVDAAAETVITLEPL